MSGTRVLTFTAALITVIASAAAARSLVRSPVPADTTAAEPPAPAPGLEPGMRSADSIARRTIGRNPFRAHRSPAAIRFRPEAEMAPPPPSPPRPSLSVAGIVLGTDPAALIDGIPGTDGTRVLRIGESVAGYTVRSIDSTRVVVASRDTTYQLPVRNRHP